MKTTIQKLMVGILGGIAIATASFAVKSDQAVVYANCQYGQCNAIAKSTGNRCKHCVSNPGDAYCYQHK